MRISPVPRGGWARALPLLAKGIRQPPPHTLRAARRHASSGSSGLPPPPPFSERRRVVVTGIGLATPHGVGAALSWEGMLSGRSRTRSLGEGFEGQPCTVAAMVPRGKGEGEFDTDGVAGFPASRTAPFVQLAVLAAQEALDDAGLAALFADKGAILAEVVGAQTGVCVGTGIGSLEDIIEAGALVKAGQSRKVSPFFVPKVLANMAGAQIAIKHGLRGPNHSMITACAAGAHNIMDAARLIAMGDADVMVAGGSESCITPLAVAGFARAKSLATEYNDRPEEASRPFDKDRCGFVMGEGAGILILEELEHAQRRSARIYAELRGWGSSGDAHHITAPAEDGEGAGRAMLSALARGGLSPPQVGHINCHATSTPLGDACEAHAIARVFQGSPELVVTSCKGGMGHLLGAAGAVEAAATVLSLYHKRIPPTVNFVSLSEDIDSSLRVASEKGGMSAPGLRAAMSNSFGFGGVNASLLFSCL